MVRPIDGDGTSRYSTGSPGVENAPAGAVWPAIPTSAGSAAAATAAVAIRRSETFARNFSTNFTTELLRHS